MHQEISLRQLAVGIQARRLTLAEALDVIEQARSLFVRPQFLREADREQLDRFVDKYSDWEIRCQQLARDLQALMEDNRRRVNSDPEMALELGRLVLAAARLFGTAEALGKASFHLGYVAWAVQDPTTAIIYLHAAAEALEQAGDHILRMYALSYQVDALIQLKEFRRAAEVNAVFLQISRDLCYRGQTCMGLRDQGRVHTGAGQVQEALRCYREALVLRDALTEGEIKEQAVISVAAFCNSLGLAARKAGNYEEAIETFQKEFEDRWAHSAFVDAATALSEMGYTYRLSGEEQRGGDYLRRAASMARDHGRPDLSDRWLAPFSSPTPRHSDPIRPSVPQTEPATLDPRRTVPPVSLAASEEEAYAIASQVESKMQAGDLDGLRAQLEWLINWGQANKDTQIELGARVNLAGLFGMQDNLFQAVMKDKTAARLALRMGDATHWVEIQGNLARHYLQMGSEVLDSNVENVLKSVLERVRVFLQQATSTETRQSIQAGAQRFYESYVLVLLTQNRPDELLRLVEQAYAQNLTGWLNADLVTRQVRLPPDTLQSLHALLLRLRAVEVEGEELHLSTDLSFSDLQRLKQSRDRIQTSMKTLLAATPELSSRIEHAMRESSVSLPQLKNVLTEVSESAIVQLFGISEGVVVCLIRCDRDIVTPRLHFIPWEREDRLKLTAGLFDSSYDSFGTRTGGENLDIQDGAFVTRHLRMGTMPKLMATLSKLSSVYFDTIVEMFEGHFPKYVALIPHRELKFIPHHELLLRAAPQTALTITPSLAVLYHCLWRKSFANGSGQKTTDLSLFQRMFQKRRPDRKPLRAVVLADQTGTLRLAPQEKELVRALRAASSVSEPRTFEQLIEQMRSCTLLHFAAHGLYKPDNPYQSGVVTFPTVEHPPPLARKAGDATPQIDRLADGFRLLTVRDILANIYMADCPVVVLSSCESGLSRIHPADEYTGLPASFLIAGARTVISTLCPVRDDVAFLMMREFYRLWNQADSKMGPAVALHQARLRVRQMSQEEVVQLVGNTTTMPESDRPFADLAYTAPFQVFGAW